MTKLLGRSCLSTVAVIAAGLLVATHAIAEPKVGAPAPDFTAVDTAGKSHKLSDLKGKTVVLEWTNHECPYVQKHYSTGNMQKLQHDAAAKGVVWLTLISSAKGTQGALDGKAADALNAERKAEPSAVLLDDEGTVGKAYDARTTPHMYVIDGKGTLRYMGAIDDKPTTENADVNGARNYVTEAVDAVLGGKEISEPVTRAYGCSVKYKS